MSRKTVAVIFGGRSVEHDVSILTGLQFLDALDTSRYDGLPVYVDPLGQMWTGDALKKRSLYPVDAEKAKSLTQISLDLSPAATDGPNFIGQIDDIRLYNRTLTEDEVKALALKAGPLQFCDGVNWTDF